MACSLGGVLVFAVFFLLAWFASPHLETYTPATLMQHLLLLPLSLAGAAALALAAGLVLPRGVALCTALAIVFPGERLFQFLASKSVLAHLVPRFGSLNLATRYTDGVAAPSLSAFVLLVMYAMIWTLFGLVLAHAFFRRRAL